MFKCLLPQIKLTYNLSSLNFKSFSVCDMSFKFLFTMIPLSYTRYCACVRFKHAFHTRKTVLAFYSLMATLCNLYLCLQHLSLSCCFNISVFLQSHQITCVHIAFSRAIICTNVADPFHFDTGPDQTQNSDLKSFCFCLHFYLYQKYNAPKYDLFFICESIIWVRY